MKRLLSLAAVVFVAACAASPAYAERPTNKTELVTPNTCTVAAAPQLEVMTIEASPAIAFASIGEVKPAATSMLDKLAPLVVLPFLFAGSIKTGTMDKDTNPPMLQAIMQANEIVKDFYYWTQNRIIAATAATYPVVATGTTTSKVKTTNATVCLNDGVVNAVAATDDAWVLTGGVLAISSFRKYLLLVSAADAFTVQASDDQATAAACRFANRPADGLTILGVLTVGTSGAVTFTPGTTLLGAAGITATYIDGSGDVPFLSKALQPLT